MKSTSLTVLLLAFCAFAARAEPVDPYFVDPALAPYPPGCVTLLDRQAALYGDNAAPFWSGRLKLDRLYPTPGGPGVAELETTLYRVGCAEPDRSVIVVELRFPVAWDELFLSHFWLPTFVAMGPDGTPIPFDLKLEPNTWGQSAEQLSLTKRAIGDYSSGFWEAWGYTWRYFLDMAPAGAGRPLMAEFYNEAFELRMVSNDSIRHDFSIPVPATRDLLGRNPTLPLNGRLTGIWTEPGAVDQGFLLSFSDVVPPAGTASASTWEPELHAFLSWYTFDTEGRQIWFAGNARFQPGASEVAMPLVEMVYGEFLAEPSNESQGADARRSAGQVRLRARSCNELELEYELTDPRLGAGTLPLRRLFALETAGYPCRDYAARLANQTPDTSHHSGE